jgi:hypothetical protein
MYFSIFSLDCRGVISAGRLEQTFTWFRVIRTGLRVTGTNGSSENFVIIIETTSITYF